MVAAMPTALPMQRPAGRARSTATRSTDMFMVFLMSAALLGHHSFAAFDMEKANTLSGVVKEFQWRNPHSWIQLMVTDASGNDVEWSIETGSPSSLSRQGWKPKALKAGDRITITMHPLRDGRPGG